MVHKLICISSLLILKKLTPTPAHQHLAQTLNAIEFITIHNAIRLEGADSAQPVTLKRIQPPPVKVHMVVALQ